MEVVADLSFHPVFDHSVCLYSYLVVDLASVAGLCFGLDFGPDSAVDLSAFSGQVPNYIEFHRQLDYCVTTFYTLLLLLHNLYQLEKALPYYGKCVPISFYPFLFCWQNHIAPWLPETFVAVRAYFPNCTWIQQI